MKKWLSIFKDEMFWIMYFRLFLRKAEYNYIYEDKRFSNLLEKLYAQKGEQKIILKYPGNYEIHIVFSGDPDRGNTDAFYLTHPSFTKRLFLGEDSPHFLLPIFHFDEFEALISIAEVDFDPCYIPLLLLKAVGVSKTEPYADIQKKVISSFKKANVFGKNIEELFPTLLPPQESLCWEYDENYGWINNIDLSSRKRNNTNKNQ